MIVELNPLAGERLRPLGHLSVPSCYRAKPQKTSTLALENEDGALHEIARRNRNKTGFARRCRSISAQSVRRTFMEVVEMSFWGPFEAFRPMADFQFGSSRPHDDQPRATREPSQRAVNTHDVPRDELVAGLRKAVQTLYGCRYSEIPIAKELDDLLKRETGQTYGEWVMAKYMEGGRDE